MTVSTRPGQDPVVIAMLAVLGSLLTAAILVAALPSPWTDAARLPFRLICHGIPERSFTIAGHLLPVCGRCIGIYLGAVVSASIALAVRARRGSIALGVVLMLPMALDGFAQAIGIWTSGNGPRFITGLVFAIGFTTAILGRRTRSRVVEVLETTVSMR